MNKCPEILALWQKPGAAMPMGVPGLFDRLRGESSVEKIHRKIQSDEALLKSFQKFCSFRQRRKEHEETILPLVKEISKAIEAYGWGGEKAVEPFRELETPEYKSFSWEKQLELFDLATRQAEQFELFVQQHRLEEPKTASHDNAVHGRESAKCDAVAAAGASQQEAMPRVAEAEKEEASVESKTRPTGKPMTEKKPLPAEAFTAYRLYHSTDKTQAQIAAQLQQEIGKPVRQSQVSKWISQVKKFIADGNVLPDAPQIPAEDSAVDSGPLDIGEWIEPGNRSSKHAFRYIVDSA